MSIRWKIMLLCLCVVFVPIYFLNYYAIHFFDRFTRTALEEQMIDYAYMVGEELRPLLDAPDDAEAWADFASRLIDYQRELQTRLRVIDRAGVVSHDSHPESSVGEDMSERYEVSQALGGRYGAQCRLTDDGRFMYYYIALPILQEGHPVAVVMASRHTGSIMVAIKSMIMSHRIAMYISLLLSLGIALLVASTMTRRLRRLTRAASAYARGDQVLDADVRGRDEIGELGRAFSRMADEIQRKSNGAKELLATTVHELKTPLTAIKGAVEVLGEGAADKPEARRKFLSNIDIECERMIRMVNELRTLYQLDTEELRGQKAEVQYLAFLRDVLERIEPTFGQDRARLVTDFPAKDFPVKVAPYRIEQVLTNLLDNAFRYTPPEGQVTLTVAREEGVVTTGVLDTGPGVPRDLQPRVFEHFFTTEARNRQQEYGSGLGLAVALSIITNHGGRIWVESAPEKGAAFYFQLPMN
ncbi:MAG: HAMP domain-containing histidine kinase [Spartobacteria bacterium]|nr:HAMP domain-containing histidine kinase [Spartobacteria bacterium]